MSELDAIKIILAVWLYLVAGLFVMVAVLLRDPDAADQPVFVFSLFDWLAWPYVAWRKRRASARGRARRARARP